jgi:hypothetical protein
MTDDEKKAAVVRAMRLAASVQRDEGLKLDGRDPAWRKLCNDPNLASLTDDEIKSRVRELASEVEGYTWAKGDHVN